MKLNNLTSVNAHCVLVMSDETNYSMTGKSCQNPGIKTAVYGRIVSSFRVGWINHGVMSITPCGLT